MMTYILMICLNASGAECGSRELYPYGTQGQCEVARMETGLPQPDYNFAPAYRGQDTAVCIKVDSLYEEAAPEPEPRGPVSYTKGTDGRVKRMSF